MTPFFRFLNLMAGHNDFKHFVLNIKLNPALFISSNHLKRALTPITSEIIKAINYEAKRQEKEKPMNKETRQWNTLKNA